MDGLSVGFVEAATGCEVAMYFVFALFYTEFVIAEDDLVFIVDDGFFDVFKTHVSLEGNQKTTVIGDGFGL